MGIGIVVSNRQQKVERERLSVREMEGVGVDLELKWREEGVRF